MGNHTPLHDLHLAAGARMVDFGGWDMPLAYGSQIEEHHAVRRRAGMFDVSHMTVVDVEGDGARDYLLRLLANDVGKLATPGRALYGCMLNERGGVVDDLITYFVAEGRYRMVVNAATREQDLAWMQAQAGDYDVRIAERPDLAMIAVQGPEAREIAAECLPAEDREPALALKPFAAHAGETHFVARTGYTGEDGWEIISPAEAAIELWSALKEARVQPCGLGARDTLRLEAGLNLYGADMDETTTPAESNLGWTVAMEPAGRDFIGREALEAEAERGVARRLTGLVLEGKGILRGHQKLRCGAGEGEITSGGYSPTIGVSIGLARVPAAADGEAAVEIRGREHAVRLVDPPFVRRGKIMIETGE